MASATDPLPLWQLLAKATGRDEQEMKALAEKLSGNGGGITSEAQLREMQEAEVLPQLLKPTLNLLEAGRVAAFLNKRRKTSPVVSTSDTTPVAPPLAPGIPHSLA